MDRQDGPLREARLYAGKRREILLLCGAGDHDPEDAEPEGRPR